MKCVLLLKTGSSVSSLKWLANFISWICFCPCCTPLLLWLYHNYHMLFLKLFQDYEYASYNPVAYDLANHFCEMVANYHSEKPHFLDYRKYPGNCWVDLFTILHFIFSYLTCRTQSSCNIE